MCRRQNDDAGEVQKRLDDAKFTFARDASYPRTHEIKKIVSLQCENCREKTYFSRQNTSKNNMENIENKVITKIRKCGRGNVFLSADFAKFGKTESVRTVLQRLVKKGILLRYARGIYYYPKIDKRFGMGMLSPSIEDVAQSIAKRDNAHIVPTGVYALNRLGLSTQVPMNFVYLTDGTPRRIKIGPQNGILFIHTSPKNLAFKNELAMLITFALKEIGKNKVTQEHLDKIKYLLFMQPKEQIMNDAKLMPSWIKSLIMDCYE
ncbi:MAG: DUF6088 family protein [Prevotellaceae bacterium]|nr:DUF6088 family protein [Prevotellaceae bacterium]